MIDIWLNNYIYDKNRDFHGFCFCPDKYGLGGLYIDEMDFLIFLECIKKQKII